MHHHRHAKHVLRLLARRYQTLTSEIGELDTRIKDLCARANPALLATTGIGPDTAAALLVAAGDNPERMRSEASFAALCRQSRPGILRTSASTAVDRQANNALWRIATTALRPDHHPTQTPNKPASAV